MNAPDIDFDDEMLDDAVSAVLLVTSATVLMVW
jgi:hypothetical protein